MKLINSEFILEKLSIEGSFCNYIEPESGSIGAPIKSGDIESSFDILSSESDAHIFKVVLDLHTHERLENGYQFGCLCEGVFSFEDSDKPREDMYMYLTRSGLAAMYAHIRAFIISLTAQSSGGIVLLPTIDLTDFIKKKEAEEEKVTEVEEPKQKKQKRTSKNKL